MSKSNKYISKKWKKTFIKSMPLLIIILIGFLWRLYYSQIMVLRGDETGYMYQSYLISKGYVPYKDFIPRAPVLLYFVAPFITIFGRSVIAVRFSAVLISTFNIFLLYLLVKKIGNHKIALYAAAFFAFTPYNIRSGCMVRTEILSTFLVTLATYMTVKALMDSKVYYLIIAGLVIGLSFYVRRTSWLFIFIIPLFIFSYNLMKKENYSLKTNVKKTFKGCFIFIISTLMLMISLYLFLASMTSLEEIKFLIFGGASVGASFDIHLFSESESLNSLTNIVLRLFFVIVFFMMFLIGIFKKYTNKSKLAYKLILPLVLFVLYERWIPFDNSEIFNLIVIILLVGATLPLSIIMELKHKYGEIEDILIAIFSIFTIFILIKYLLHYGHLWFHILLYVLIIGIIEVIVSNIKNLKKCENPIIKKYVSTKYILPLKKPLFFIYKNRLFVLSIVLVYFFLFLEESIFDQQEKMLISIIYIFSFIMLTFLVRFIKFPKLDFKCFLTIIWFSFFFILYLYYGYNLEFYFYEFAIPMSIGAGIVLYRLFKDIPIEFNFHRGAFITIAICSILVSHSIILNIAEQQSNSNIVSPDTSHKVAEYLQEHTTPGEEVFTGTYSMIIEADLIMVLNITARGCYQDKNSSLLNNSVINYPTVDDIKEYLINKPVQYCIIDPLTALFYFNEYPDFKDFIYEHYELEKTIVNVDIYRIKGGSNN